MMDKIFYPIRKCFTYEIKLLDLIRKYGLVSLNVHTFRLMQIIGHVFMAMVSLILLLIISICLKCKGELKGGRCVMHK